jgi:S-adenosylmethionine hydrolase
LDNSLENSVYESRKEFDKLIKEMREKYRSGTRIRMIEMRKEYSVIKSGEQGKVSYVDDWGNIFVNWDNEKIVSIIPYEDKFEII